MKNFRLFLVLWVLLVNISPLTAENNKQQLTIGILAHRGEQRTFLRWQPWIDDLNRHFQKYNFKLVPLGVDYIEYYKKSNLDFILSNQSQIFLDNANESKWLLTLLSPPHGYGKDNVNQIGSTILVLKNSPFQKLTDLKNKTVAAVSENAFGGYLIGYQQFLDHKMKENRDFKVKFYGFPVDKILYALRDKKVSAAIAPTCLLETMVNEGTLDFNDFRVLNLIHNDTDCLSSTQLLPNWQLTSLIDLDPIFEKKFTDYLLSSNTNPNLPKWSNAYYNNDLFKILHNMRNNKKANSWVVFKHWIAENSVTFSLIIIVIALFITNFIYLTYTLNARTKKLNLSFKQLQEYQNMLSHADRMNTLGEMSAGIAHEIHQPLTAINLYALGLQVSQKDEKSTAVLNKIIEQVARIKTIIQNLRSFSEKRPEKEQKIVDLKPIIARSVKFMSNSNDKKIKITIKCSNHLQACVRDSVLEQVICNSILNSIQANAQLIQIITEDKTDFVLIKIIDDGKGFTEEMLKFPFVPFKTTKESGMGLGMVICQRLIQAEFGDINIGNNTDGSGAVITIKLNKKEFIDNNNPHINEVNLN